jgi:F420-non-reducing hydrogenase large subunit
VIELIYTAERFQELANDKDITSTNIRNIPTKTPDVGIGVVEAPRGTLIHHYETDEKGIIEKANLIVATQNNAARIAMSVEKAAKGLIHEGNVNDGLLNMVEMAFRAYDPCHACGTHALPGRIPLKATVYNSRKEVVATYKNTD